MSFEYGDSDSTNADVKLYRIGAAVGLEQAAGSTPADWHLGGYWDLSLGYWDNRQPCRRRIRSITEIGLTPVFRLQRTIRLEFRRIVEAAIGFHFLSATSVSPERKFGSSFQFGDHLGAGLRFGDKGHYDVSYRYQHLSNAGIKDPNQGINFHQLRLQYHF